MAEAIALAASVVQLTDAAVRTSLGLYAFFAALHKAEPEFQCHIIVLRDVHDGIQLLRGVLIDSPGASSLSDDEAAALKRQLGSISDTLSSLEKITAGKDPSRLTSKLKWVLKKGDTQKALQDLESHKTSLLILLQTLDLGRSRQLLCSQNAIAARLGSLESRLAQLGKDERIIGAEMEAKLDRMAATMRPNLDFYQQSLQEGFANVSQGFEASGPTAGHAVRHALEAHLQPFLQMALTKYETTQKIQNSTMMQEFQSVLNEAALKISAHIADVEVLANSHAGDSPGESSTGSEPRRDLPSDQSDPRTSASHDDHVRPGEPLLDIGTREPRRTTRHRKPTKAFRWSYWANIPQIGIFKLEYSVSAEPGCRFYTFTACFWPSTVLFLRRGFSLKYSSRPDREGYSALCPSLATYSIISDNDPIWGLVRADSVLGVMSRFREKMNEPRNIGTHGKSLLGTAIIYHSFEVIEYLLSLGLKPSPVSVETPDGWDYLSMFVWWTFNIILTWPQMKGVDGDLVFDRYLSSFVPTVRSFIDAGWDLDDLPHYRIFLGDDDLRIISHLSHPDEGLRLNHRISDHLSDSSDSPSGGDLDIPRSHRQIDRAQYLSHISRFADLLRLEGSSVIAKIDYEQTLRRSPYTMTLPILQALGLKGNERTAGGHMNPLIYTAIRSCFELQQEGTDVPFRNLVTLLANGASPYEVEPALDTFAHSFEDGLLTPTAFARYLNILPTWVEALAEAGYDPDEVLGEDERRRREYRLLYGARSSAVDAGDVTSENSLRRRVPRAREN